MATKKNTETKEIVTVNDAELLAIIEQRQEYKNMIDEAKRIVEELDAKIKEAIENSGSNEIIVGCHKATLSKYVKESVSTSDVKSIVSQELFDKIAKRTMTTRLTVK